MSAAACEGSLFCFRMNIIFLFLAGLLLVEMHAGLKQTGTVVSHSFLGVPNCVGLSQLSGWQPARGTPGRMCDRLGQLDQFFMAPCDGHALY